MTHLNLEDIGRLAAPTDNCAIATKTLQAGTKIEHDGSTFALSHTVLVGHRFAVRLIVAGDYLLSWGMPFGTALRAIEPGEYVCNALVIEELNHHRLPFAIPSAPNFTDDIPPFVFDKDHFAPADPLPAYDSTASFMGYRRDANRGVGTRNTIILLGTNGTVSGFVRRLESDLKKLTLPDNVDGIVAIAHTEGMTADPNNRELLLRTLARFIVHPNVAAALIIDNGVNGLTNKILNGYLADNGYPLDAVPHSFLSIDGPFQEKLAEAAGIVAGWLPVVSRMRRTAEPLSELKIALQCGGSDSFSGISGNPLISWVAKELIMHGGAANLAETDELVGAESYVLDKCRSEATAEQFLATIDRFKQWAARHGHSAEGNPSGGNRYRGLYNIYLKSLGAATKRHPDVPLDYVIDYSAPMTEPGYYFMDSPGNDLESIAGQVAAGCNMIFFVTGNGSITNFPFVPTLKVVTTSERYQLLSDDMDIDAGEYLTGKPLDELGQETLDRLLETASGRLSVGEKAGHSQVQIWRNWSLGSGVEYAKFNPVESYSGLPLSIPADEFDAGTLVWAMEPAASKINLILPTSLCSGQIAQMVVAQLNRRTSGRFVTLVHTEGCGATTQEEFVDTMLGYMSHPLVENCLLLEHGCEKTHNSYWRTQMAAAGLPLEDYGWASIQQDGGIEKSMTKMRDWFHQRSSDGERGGTAVCLGLTTDGTAGLDDQLAAGIVSLIQQIVAVGGSVIIPEHDQLLTNDALANSLSLTKCSPTIGYAQPPKQAGLHIMAGRPDGWTELLTGLGASGCDLFLSFSDSWPKNGHPLVPLVQVGLNVDATADWDFVIDANFARWDSDLKQLVSSVRAGTKRPNAQVQQNVDFQITRGTLGISM